MATLAFTIIGLYEADPANYSTDDPDVMAKLDQADYDNGAIGLTDIIEWANERDITVRFGAAK